MLNLREVLGVDELVCVKEVTGCQFCQWFASSVKLKVRMQEKG